MRSRGPARSNALSNNCLSAPNHSPPPGSSEPASGLEYPLDTRANLFVVHELTPLDLVEANLYLLPEPLVIGKQASPILPFDRSFQCSRLRVPGKALREGSTQGIDS